MPHRIVDSPTKTSRGSMKRESILISAILGAVMVSSIFLTKGLWNITASNY